ncbi:MAG TPA: 6-carboxytetrahydropterin synthase QueD [Burkholderiales bacterium]|nr:6-carboxytetrahydropterin synthase QueD [Burkholderiales bacterium]
MIRITKRLEFDAGHRIPDHRSVCRNLHGHRYVMELSLEGEVKNIPGASDHGMLLDFSEVKAMAKEHLVDQWDHAFLVYEGDEEVVKLLAALPDHKTVMLNRVPTAEHLARIAFETLAPLIDNRYGNQLRLAKIRLYETPNSWAEYGAKD